MKSIVGFFPFNLAGRLVERPTPQYGTVSDLCVPEGGMNDVLGVRPRRLGEVTRRWISAGEACLST